MFQVGTQVFALNLSWKGKVTGGDQLLWNAPIIYYCGWEFFATKPLLRIKLIIHPVILHANAFMSGSILIIENEIFLREALIEILNIVGLNTFNALNGREAVTTFQACQDDIDLVIMDMRLPDMDGAQILQELEMIQPDVKVIVSSGEDKQKLLRQFARHPNVSILAKPYDMDMMLNRVWQMLEH